MERDDMNVKVRVVVNENNVNHQIDIDLDAIVQSEEGKNRIVWRSRDGKYKLTIWKYGYENQVSALNVDKDENIVSSSVEIANQVNMLKLENI